MRNPPRGTRDEIQDWMIQSYWEDFHNGIRSMAGVAPTGFGKTRVGGRFISEFLAQYGGPALWVAPRTNLVDAAEMAFADLGLSTLREQATWRAHKKLDRYECDVVVASLDTLTNRLDCFGRDRFKLIITDECHYSLEQIGAVLEYFTPELLIAQTATDRRLDGRLIHGPDSIFGHCSFRYTIPDAIRAGHLPPIKSHCLPVNIDVSKISTRGKSKDYSDDEIEAIVLSYLDPICNAAVQEIANIGLDHFLMFAPTVHTAQIMADVMTNLGVECHAVYGGTKKHPMSPETSSQIIASHRRGEFPGLVNVDLLSFGYDDASLQAVFMFFATKSYIRFMQSLGRVTRLHPGKEFAHVIGLSWGDDGEAMSTIDLFREPDISALAIKKAKALEKSCPSADPFDLLERAKAEAEIEEALARDEEFSQMLAEDRRLRRRKVQRKQVDYMKEVTYPYGFAERFHVNMVRDDSPITPNQAADLHRMGFTGIGGISYSEAQAIIDKATALTANGGASIKVREWVRKHCPWYTEEKIANLTAAEGRKIMATRIGGKRG